MHETRPQPLFWRRLLLAAWFVALLATAGIARGSEPVLAESPTFLDPTDSCQAATAMLAEQNRMLSRELRSIKREIAVLNQNLEKPGLRDAMAGIGYIIGLFGTAAFFSSRRNRQATGK